MNRVYTVTKRRAAEDSQAHLENRHHYGSFNIQIGVYRTYDRNKTAFNKSIDHYIVHGVRNYYTSVGIKFNVFLNIV